jgi:hypothetical protein
MRVHKWRQRRQRRQRRYCDFAGGVLRSPTPARSPSCDYYPGGPFQALLKQGETESAISSFLAKQFGLALSTSLSCFAVENSPPCNRLGRDILISGDSLIAVRGGAIFFGYTRGKVGVAGVAPSASAAIHSSANTLPKPSPELLESLPMTALPFQLKSYIAQCLANFPMLQGVPRASSSCGATFKPTVAASRRKESLVQLVGRHPYQKGGARNESGDYNDPFSNGLHPVFLVFPPMRDVIVIRVDDIERAQERDPIRGAYLVVKDGAVTDQLNNACDLDARYRCINSSTGQSFQLTEAGRFEKQ